MKYLLLALILGLQACGGSSDATDPIDLAQQRGQWIVINYWAKWCKPCIKEIPELNALDQQHAQVTVLGVNYDGASGAELEQQLSELGVAFATLETDPATMLGIPRPVVLPTTLILAPDGQLKATLVGPQTLESLLRATVQSGATTREAAAGDS